MSSDLVRDTFLLVAFMAISDVSARSVVTLCIDNGKINDFDAFQTYTKGNAPLIYTFIDFICI